MSLRAKDVLKKQTFLSKELREEALVEEAKYETDLAIKKLVLLIGQTEAKKHVEETRYLPF